jgi:hypothetical protein
MKTIKSKFRVLTYLICFSFLAVTQISCENNDDFEEIIEQTDKVKKAEAQNAAKANIKRTRLKRRPNSLYRTTVKVKDNNNEVSAVALEIEKKEGFINETKTYNLAYFTTIKGEKYYTFGDIKFENKEIENQEITVNITFLDAKKEVIGNSTDVITVSGLAKANIKTGRTRMKERRNGLYKLTTEIEDPENVVAAVELTVTDLKGNNATINTAPNNNNTIKADFSFQKESIANTFLVISSLKDMFGDVVGESKEEVEVEIESSYKIGKVLFNQTSEGLYTALVTLKNDTENDVEKITLTVEKGEGIADKTITYDLKYLNTEKGVKYYTNQKVALIESKVKDIPVVVTTYLRNRDGDGGRSRRRESVHMNSRRRRK